MSCKSKWQEYNDQLQAATQLAPGSADAAPRCVKPECNRPLLKDGTCVMGHAQAAGTQPSPTPLRAALRCVFEDAVAAAGQHSTQWYYSYMQKALDSTRDLIDKIADDTADPAAIEELLEALIWLQDNEPYSTVYSNLYLDPRVDRKSVV